MFFFIRKLLTEMGGKKKRERTRRFNVLCHSAAMIKKTFNPQILCISENAINSTGLFDCLFVFPLKLLLGLNSESLKLFNIFLHLV